VLPEPLQLVRGTHVGLELMASRCTDFTEQARACDWLDQAYMLMRDLTGQQPDAGALLVLQESPPHPYFAYAGNPIVLNTHYVAETLHAIETNRIPFGWIHEIGHVFDVLGPWHNWNAAAAEWQANFKLAYVFEHLQDQSWTIDWRAFRNPSFGHSLWTHCGPSTATATWPMGSARGKRCRRMNCILASSVYSGSTAGNHGSAGTARTHT
jgi:hypothetical protein